MVVESRLLRALVLLPPKESLLPKSVISDTAMCKWPWAVCPGFPQRDGQSLPSITVRAAEDGQPKGCSLSNHCPIVLSMSFDPTASATPPYPSSPCCHGFSWESQQPRWKQLLKAKRPPPGHLKESPLHSKQGSARAMNMGSYDRQLAHFSRSGTGERELRRKEKGL